MSGKLDLNDDQEWNNDALQFARIINHLRRMLVFDSTTVSNIAEEFGLESEHIDDLLIRSGNVVAKFAIEQRTRQ